MTDTNVQTTSSNSATRGVTLPILPLPAVVLPGTVVTVEGTPVRARRVEERKRGDRSLQATWYLTLESPYMVYGEVPLADGRVQRMTEVPVPMSAAPRPH